MTAPATFLTGFPGFLGSALLERLLARGDGPVACLVQPRYRDLAERRAAEVVDAAGVEADEIRLYEGDVTEPDLGLGDALEGTGIARPPFEPYVDRLVAYVREHPDVGDEAMV